MKKLPITKEAFEKSKYFTNKYGKLEYVSESGKLFKTSKGKIMKFKESVEKGEPKFGHGDSVIWNDKPCEVVESFWDSVTGQYVYDLMLLDSEVKGEGDIQTDVPESEIRAKTSSNGDYARRLDDAMSVVKEIGESGLLSSAWGRQIQKLYDNLEGLKMLVERKQ